MTVFGFIVIGNTKFGEGREVNIPYCWYFLTTFTAGRRQVLVKFLRRSIFSALVTAVLYGQDTWRSTSDATPSRSCSKKVRRGPRHEHSKINLQTEV